MPPIQDSARTVSCLG